MPERKKPDEQFEERETQRRLEAALRGAFAGRPQRR